jgi:SAM-dependent methyltransferase
MAESFSYAVVFSQHWLEHVVDLNFVFLKIKRLLKDDGLLFLEVPNCENPYWEYRFFPNPPHLHFFTPESLRRLAEKYHLQVLFLMTYGKALEFEKSVGYLKPETPALLSRTELSQLEAERDLKCKRFYESLAADTALTPKTDYFKDAYQEHGREFIRLVATPGPKEK